MSNIFDTTEPFVTIPTELLDDAYQVMWATANPLKAFAAVAPDFTPAQVCQVLVGVAQKFMSTIDQAVAAGILFGSQTKFGTDGGTDDRTDFDATEITIPVGVLVDVLSVALVTLGVAPIETREVIAGLVGPAVMALEVHTQIGGL